MGFLAALLLLALPAFPQSLPDQVSDVATWTDLQWLEQEVVANRNAINNLSVSSGSAIGISWSNITGFPAPCASPYVVGSVGLYLTCVLPTTMGSAGGSLTGSYPNPAIAAGAVVAGNIAADAVTSAAIIDSAVQTSKIDTDAVTSANIMNSAVQTAAIAVDAIQTAKLMTDSVTTVKLVNSAVQTSKLAADAVTSASLINTGVTSGSYGSATNVGAFTVDDKGRITAASNVPISSAGNSLMLFNVLNSTDSTTSWLLQVDTDGALRTTPTTYVASTFTSFKLQDSGSHLWTYTVDNDGALRSE